VAKSDPRFIRDLLAPHSKALTLGLLAAVGEGVANLLDPWPLKIVLDNVLRGRPIHGWLNPFILRISAGDKHGVLLFAALAALAIAMVGRCARITKNTSLPVSGNG
jgi:subfamily B ATP-binding cassette protein MsbA